MMSEVRPVTFIEGLVYLGLIKSVTLVECETPGYYRVVAESNDGKTYATKCMAEEAARRLAGVWTIYIKRGWRVTEEQSDLNSTP